MVAFNLKFVLETDATFGRGDGVAGAVDMEVQHDEWGCPYLGGRALKGLLVAECAEILAAIPKEGRSQWKRAAHRLFGRPGSGTEDGALLTIGDGRLPEDLRRAIAADVRSGKLTREEVLEAITALRRQTAVDETGVPREHTLRTVRVILRGTPFRAELHFAADPEENDLALLAACVKAFRRAGTGRNRGRGRLKAELLDATGRVVTAEYFEIFRRKVVG